MNALKLDSATMTHSLLSYATGSYDTIVKVLELKPERIDDDTD